MTVERWYAIGTRTVHCCSDTAVWYHSGLPPVAIRWLLVKDPEERFTPQAFLSTDRTLTPQQMLSFLFSAGKSKPPLKKPGPIWVWKRKDSGMTRPLPGLRRWCWPYSPLLPSWPIP